MPHIIRLLILLLMSSPAWAEQILNLEGLMNEGVEHPAPEALRAQLEQEPALQEDLRAVQEYIQERQRDGRIEKNFVSIFAATPITLSTTGRPVYIVYPSVYNPVFVGAHAIWYWIMEEQPDGTYRDLLSGATDVVYVLDTQTLGYHDLSTTYGPQEPSLYRFDGTTYTYVSAAEPTDTEPPDPMDTSGDSTSSPIPWAKNAE